MSDDKVDDASTFEVVKDLECADVDSRSVCVEVVEDERDLAAFVIDAALGLDELVVRRVGDDSVLEAVEEILGTDNDVIPFLVDVGEDRTDVDSKLDNVEDVAGGEIGPVPTSDNVDELEIDDDAMLESLEDVAGVEVGFPPRSIEAVEGEFDDKPVGGDERDVAGVFVDVIC